MTVTATAESVPLFAFADAAPSAKGRELVVAPAKPQSQVELAVDGMVAAANIAERHGERSGRLLWRWGLGLVPAQIASASIGTRIFAANLQSYAAEETSLTCAAVGMGVWAALGCAHLAAAWWMDRNALLAQNPLEPVRDLALSSIEQAVLAETANRARRSAGRIWLTGGWQRSLALDGAVTPDSPEAKAVSRLLDCLFRSEGLGPNREPMNCLEMMIDSIERIPADQRPLLRKVVDTAFASAGIKSPTAKTYQWYQHAMLQAALGGTPFRFGDHIASDAPLSSEAARERDLAIAEIEFNLQKAQSAGGPWAAFGLGRVSTLDQAIRVAAHFEAKGLRVSLGRKRGEGPRLSVVAYEASREPNTHMHNPPERTYGGGVG